MDINNSKSVRHNGNIISNSTFYQSNTDITINDLDENSFVSQTLNQEEESKKLSSLKSFIDKMNCDEVSYFLESTKCNSKTLNLALLHTLEKSRCQEKIEILTLLLNFGANPNLINPKCNRSILMIAASNGDIESVNLILEFKANVLYKDKQGQNALFYALNSKKGDNQDVVEMLVHYSTEVNILNNNNESPLLIACRENLKQSAIILIERKADINIIDKLNGNSLLHYAAEHGNLELAKILISKNINIKQINKDNHTALNVAMTKNRNSIISLINDEINKRIISEKKNVDDLNKENLNKQLKIIKKDTSKTQPQLNSSSSTQIIKKEIVNKKNLKMEIKPKYKDTNVSNLQINNFSIELISKYNDFNENNQNYLSYEDKHLLNHYLEDFANEIKKLEKINQELNEKLLLSRKYMSDYLSISNDNISINSRSSLKLKNLYSFSKDNIDIENGGEIKLEKISSFKNLTNDKYQQTNEINKKSKFDINYALDFKNLYGVYNYEEIDNPMINARKKNIIENFKKESMTSLNKSIIEFKNLNTLKVARKEKIKDEIIKNIDLILLSIDKSYKSQIFGSYATNISLFWSDLDILIVPENSYIENFSILKEIHDNLINQTWVNKCRLIENTAMPIIKITCTDEFMNFNLDISLKQKDHYGLQCIDLVKSYLTKYKNLEYLILVIKHILKLNDLNDPFKGGISSYGIVLMVVYYIQNYIKMYDIKMLNVNNQEILSHLLMGFFFFYSIYEKSPKVIDVEEISFKINASALVSYFKNRIAILFILLIL